MTHLDRYLAEIVDPAIAEFKGQQWIRRRGFVACVCLFHVVDYFPSPPSKEKRRQQFGKASPDFVSIDRVAHAFKHEHTGHEKHPRIRPLRSSHVRQRPPAFFGLMRLGVSRLGDRSGGLMVAGEREDLFRIVVRARAFIEQQRILLTNDAGLEADRIP